MTQNTKHSASVEVACNKSETRQSHISYLVGPSLCTTLLMKVNDMLQLQLDYTLPACIGDLLVNKVCMAITVGDIP